MFEQIRGGGRDKARCLMGKLELVLTPWRDRRGEKSRTGDAGSPARRAVGAGRKLGVPAFREPGEGSGSPEVQGGGLPAFRPKGAGVWERTWPRLGQRFSARDDCTPTGTGQGLETFWVGRIRGTTLPPVGRDRACCSHPQYAGQLLRSRTIDPAPTAVVPEPLGQTTEPSRVGSRGSGEEGWC